MRDEKTDKIKQASFARNAYGILARTKYRKRIKRRAAAWDWIERGPLVPACEQVRRADG